MFQVKICGITSIKDALMVANNGADAIGLNFYPKSKRFIELPLANEIVTQLPDSVKTVGLFVNATSEEILRKSKQLELDYIQLHGDESPEFLAELKGSLELKHLPMIRAFRWTAESPQFIGEYLNRCGELGCTPDSLLIDAFHVGEYGGTGKTADWNAIRKWSEQNQIPYILAGGLTPENVSEAIQTARPIAVDTASGVEISPGVKSESDVENFASLATATFSRLKKIN